MLRLAIGLILLFDNPRHAERTEGSAKVPAMRVYVTTSTPDTASGELLRCAESLREAFTPSLSTLVPAKRRSEADIVVELEECRIVRDANVYKIEWTLSWDGNTEDIQTSRTLTESQTDDWQMREATKGVAKQVLRKVEPHRVQ